MVAQTPRSQLSPAQRERAALVYQNTKWLAWIGLGALSFALLVFIEIAFRYIPDWTRGIIHPLSLFSVMWLGEWLALWRLRRLGWEQVIREERILLERTGAHSFKVNSYFSRFAKFVPLLIFPIVWSGIFLLLTLTVFELYSPEDRRDCLIATMLITATLFIIANYLFPDSPFVRSIKEFFSNVWGYDDGEILRSMNWEQVAKIEEHKTWNNKGRLVRCIFVFRDGTGTVIRRIYSLPDGAENLLSQIEARLTGQTIGDAPA